MIDKLLKLAKKARDNSYSPYSGFPVGVALVTKNGKIFSGCNVETAHYKAVCGEASAISAMCTAGEREIATVVVIGPNMDVLCTPCGDCRQRLHEFSTDKTKIYSMWGDGTVGKIHRMKDLLPYAFGPENLLENKKRKRK